MPPGNKRAETPSCYSRIQTRSCPGKQRVVPEHRILGTAANGTVPPCGWPIGLLETAKTMVYFHGQMFDGWCQKSLCQGIFNDPAGPVGFG